MKKVETVQGLVIAKRNPLAHARKVLDLLSKGRRAEAEAMVKAQAEDDRTMARRDVELAGESR